MIRTERLQNPVPIVVKPYQYLTSINMATMIAKVGLGLGAWYVRLRVAKATTVRKNVRLKRYLPLTAEKAVLVKKESTAQGW